GGDLLNAAYHRAGSFADASLEVQARMRAAETDLEAAEAAQGRAAEAHGLLSERQQALVESRFRLVHEADVARAAEAQARAALALAQAALELEDRDDSRLLAQSARVLALLAEAQDAQRTLIERQELIASALTRLTSSHAGLEDEITEVSRRLNEALRQRQEKELRTALAEQRQEDLTRQLLRAEEVFRAHGDELAQREAAARELSAQPLLLEEECTRWLNAAAGLTVELAELESAILPDGDLLATLEAQVQAGEQRNVQLQVELAHADDAVGAAAIDAETAQAEVERCALGLRQDGQVLEEDEGMPEVDWQKTEREVSRLQRRLDGMGAVNLLAPEELGQVRDRCDSLAAQLVDLEAATAQLLDLRERLENEIDERFRTVFHSVAINFQEFFGELFEGGKATLRLEAGDAGNRLDEGVEILAQTPGKRLQPLTLLSGGERALTALAFLFALQAVNPSPFYVLDEVDAALDDANVMRFNRVLKRLSRDQQFLIVTHNHSTMAQAEVLYGVTLGEHGISRIVSVRMEHDALMPVGERTA
ncbi:MAG TPA: AAA family ATPase, partial [Candidatus Dormibacteraeota bacterium]